MRGYRRSRHQGMSCIAQKIPLARLTVPCDKQSSIEIAGILHDMATISLIGGLFGLLILVLTCGEFVVCFLPLVKQDTYRT
jgi:nicotinamide riboside transporter PnuC